MKKNILVIYPFRFRNYDFERFELVFYKKEYNIFVLDILQIVHPHFLKAYKKERLKSKVYQFKRIKDLFFFLKKFQNSSKTIIFNFNVSVNLSSFVINLIIKNLNLKMYGFNNPGNFFWSPNKLTKLKKIFYNLKQLIFDPKIFIWNLRVKFFLLLDNFFKIKLDYLFVAGSKYVPKNHGFKKVFHINSWDYSRLILNKKKLKKAKDKNIVFLDAPGPMFKSDSFLLNRKNDETAENTYPSLRSFFDKIEKKFKSKVIIAAHPKTKHKKFPRYFGGRRVAHNKTLDLISKSKLVITRNSSAITYAIYFKLPIFFIYTKEIKRKKNLGFYNIYYLAKELGLEAININNYNENILSLNKINFKKYNNFRKKYFSNIKFPLPNYKLIHQAISSTK